MADLTAETIDKILSLAPVEHFEIDGLKYTDRKIEILKPPVINGVALTTLSGLVDLYDGNFESISEDTVVFHVKSETEVMVYANTSNAYASRINYASASVKDIQAFKFGTWLNQEDFIIGLQAHFLDSGDRAYVLKLASDIAVDEKLQVTDNGVAQSVTAKSGTTLVKELDIKPRVKLSPYRTFREISQPQSEFILRVHKGPGGGPTLGLFEADGGAWKLTAMNSIKEYFEENLDGAITDESVIVIS